MSSRAPTRQIATRTRNKTAHPGLADRTKTRRTRAEAEELRANKAQAKAAREEAKQESIRRTAAFEVQDEADEDFANATPRPLFTPKQVPQPRNQAYSGLSPLPATSDAEQSDIDTRPLFAPIGKDSADKDDPTERDVTADDPVESNRTEDDETSEQDELVEENVPSPPPSRLKSQRTAAVTTKAIARGQRQVVDLESDAEMMPPPPKTKSRRKTKKGMLRADIDMAAMKIREDRDRAMLQGAKDVEGGVEREADIVSFDSSDFILIYR